MRSSQRPHTHGSKHRSPDCRCSIRQDFVLAAVASTDFAGWLRDPDPLPCRGRPRARDPLHSRRVFEYRLIRLSESDELNQGNVDDLAAQGWVLEHVVPPSHHAGSSHLLYPALIFAREAERKH